MLKRFFAGLLLALVLVVAAHAQEKTGVGTIEGRVLNGTDESILYAGQEVLLMVFSKGVRTQQRKATTDGKGNFRFTGLPVNPKLLYIITANYNNVLYVSERIKLVDSRKANYILTVYETTDSDKDIAIESHHLIVELEPGGYRIVEMLTLNNKGNRTVVSSERSDEQRAFPLFFPLPRGYRDLKIMERIPSNRIEEKPDGFYVQKHLLPGQSQMNYTYQLPELPLPLKWSKKVKYPTKNLSVFYGGFNADISSNKLKNMGVMKFGDRDYLFLKGEKLPANSSFSIFLRSSIGGTAWVAQNQALLTVIFIAGLCVVLGTFIVLRRMRQKPGEVEAVSADDSAEQRNELIESIASLDERFEAGEISRKAYERERGEKKVQLLEIIRLMGNK